MKICGLIAILPALAFAKPLTITIDESPILQPNEIVPGGVCEKGLDYCGYYLINSKGKSKLQGLVYAFMTNN